VNRRRGLVPAHLDARCENHLDDEQQRDKRKPKHKRVGAEIAPQRAGHGEGLMAALYSTFKKTTACGQLRWVELTRPGRAGARGDGERGCEMICSEVEWWR